MIHRQENFFFFKTSVAVRDFIFIALFYSAYITFQLFHQSDFSLGHFTGRAVSAATSEGVDIGLRTFTFYKGFLVFSLLFAGITWFIQRLGSFADLSDLRIINVTSAAGACLMYFHLMGADLTDSLFLILAIQLAALSGIILKKIFRSGFDPGLYQTLFVWLVSLTFAFYFLQLSLFHLSGNPETQSLPVFVLIGTVVLLILYLLIHQNNPLTSSRLSGNIIISTPFALIPLLSVLASEIYMVLNQREIHETGLSGIYLLLLALLSIWSLYRNYQWRKERKAAADLSMLLFRTWFPALCLGISILATYSAFVSPLIDQFEDANRILPLQQFFEFGKIPFLDTFSSHAVSDFGTGFLYSFINGYHPLGGAVYQFIIASILTLTVYYFILNFTQNGYIALFFALFYPFSDLLLPSYFNFIPLTVLALINVYRKPDTKSYLLFFMLLVLMLFWRIDLGTSNLVAGISSLALMFLFFPEFRSGRVQMLRGLGITLLALILIFVSTSILYDGSIMNKLRMALGYMESFQSYGLRDLSNSKDLTYFSLYFLLPLAVLMTGAWVVLKLKRAEHKNPELSLPAISLLFLIIFYFSNFQRGLVRHTLAEQWDTPLTSYGFFILASALFLSSRMRNCKTISFTIFIFLGTLILSHYKFNTPDLSRNNLYHASVLKYEQPLFPEAVDKKTERINIGAAEKDRYTSLNDFFNSNFPRTSTFLDFSNTPMLYYYLNRISPDFFCQIPHTAHNDRMQEYFLNGLSAYDIPVVIFSNVPAGFWDNLDGIPNTLRHYKITEYIYENYRPFAIIGGHSVWLRKDQDIRLPQASLSGIRSIHESVIRGGELTDSLHISSFGEEKVIIKNVLASALPLYDSLNYYLQFSITSDTQGKIAAIAGYSGNKGIQQRKTEQFLNHGSSEMFFILDRREGDDTLSSLEIQLPGSGQYALNSLELKSASIIPDLYSQQAKEDRLGLIPWFWANADRLEKSVPFEKISSLQEGLQTIGQEMEFRLALPVHAAKSDYLLLQARASGDKNARMLINYGSGDHRYGSFIFTIRNTEEMQYYRIRMCSQYNWITRKPNWISFYPLESGVEMQSAELDKDPELEN